MENGQKAAEKLAQEPIKRRGYKGRDWSRLFDEWLTSGKTKVEFLISKGIDPRTGRTREATAEWEGALAAARERMNAELTARQVESSAVNAALVSALPEVAPAELIKLAGPVPAMPDRSAIPESTWSLITRWRAGQAAQDWRTSDQMRWHIESILAQRIREVKEADGNVRIETTLKSHEVRALALALGEVQRIQRLAVGLSTENIGIDGPTDPNVEKEQGAETNPNLFVVELTKAGKFTRARPRRA